MTIAISPKPGVDRTAEIQALINTAKNDTLAFAPGEYILGPLKIRPDQISKVMGYQPWIALTQKNYVTFKARPNGGEWQRLFTVQWERDGLNSPPITFSFIDFDMNKDNQAGWDGGHNLEHQGAIFVGTTKGRLNCNITRCNFRNSVGDAVYVQHNSTVNITYCTGTDIYRGMPAVTGKNSVVVVDNLKCISNTLITGIDTEPNSEGHIVNVTLKNSTFQKFDIYCTAGSTILCDNITVEPGITVLYNEGGNFLCKNSRIFIDDNYKVRHTGISTFDNTTITATRGRNPSLSAREFNLLSLVFVGDPYNINSPLNKNQLMKLLNCKFRTDKTITEADSVNAVRIGKHSEYLPEFNNGVIMQNCNIDGLFDKGCWFETWAYLNVVKTYFNAVKPWQIWGPLTTSEVTYGPRKTP